MVVKQNVLTPEMFLNLYTSVGWEPPGTPQVRAALEHTMATFTAFDSDSPVGMVSLELISTKEAVPFYLGKGFEERPCDWDGPGMFKMIKRD